MASTRQQHPPANTKKSHFPGHPARPRTSVAASPGKRGLPLSGPVSGGRAPALAGEGGWQTLRRPHRPPPAAAAATAPPGRRLRPRRRAVPPPARRGQHRAVHRAAARARRWDPRPPRAGKQAGRRRAADSRGAEPAGTGRKWGSLTWLGGGRGEKRAASLKGRPRQPPPPPLPPDAGETQRRASSSSPPSSRPPRSALMYSPQRGRAPRHRRLSTARRGDGTDLSGRCGAAPPHWPAPHRRSRRRRRVELY